MFQLAVATFRFTAVTFPLPTRAKAHAHKDLSLTRRVASNLLLKAQGSCGDGIRETTAPTFATEEIGIMTRHKLALVTLVLALAVPAFATNGYFSHGQGTTSKALGGAGIALPEDPLAAASNPAALNLLPQEYYLSFAFFNPNREYTIKGNPSGYPQTFGLTPGTVKSGSDLFVMPSFAINWNRGNRNAFGIAFVAHGGMNTDYPTSTFYGSNSGVDLAQMFFNGTWSRRIRDNQSVGITAIVAYQRFKATGLEAFGLFSGDPSAISNQGYDDSFGLGVRVGYLGQLTPRFSVGASYSPTIRMSKLEKYAGLFADGGSFDIPASLQAGFAYKATARVTLVGDYERIHYSDVRSVGHHMLPNMMECPLGDTEGAGFGWNDMDIYKAGVEFKSSPIWAWRAGYSTGNQPIPASEVLFNILAPGVIQDHVTAGFSRTFRQTGRTFNFSVMYALENTVTGTNPLEVPGQQQIELKMDEWEMEFSYSFRF